MTTSELVVLDAGAVRDPGRGLTDRAASGLDDDGDGQPDPGAEPAPQPTPAEDDDLTAPDAVTEPTRSDQVRVVDQRVGAVLDAVTRASHPTTVLVVSIADSGRAPHLQLAAALGPPVVDGAQPFTESMLSARSTRQPGYVMTTDLTPTVLAGLGIRDAAPEGALVGAAGHDGPRGTARQPAGHRDDRRGPARLGGPAAGRAVLHVPHRRQPRPVRAGHPRSARRPCWRA